LSIGVAHGTRRRGWVPPLLLFAVSLTLCLSFSLFAKPLPVTDEFLTYYRIAQNIAAGNGFTADGATPYVYLPPLFSSLLGLWFFLTGHQTMLAVQVFQSLCIAASVACSYYLFKEVFSNDKAPLLAGAWVAIHPSLWTYAVFVRQEPTILLVTTIAAWMTVRWLRVPGTASAALAGGAWGVATLAKTITMFVPVLLLCQWALLRRKDRRIPSGELAVAFLFFFLAIAPWTARNFVHFHRLIPVNDQGLGMLEWNVQHSDAPVDEVKRAPELLLATLHTKDATRGDLAGEKFLMELDRQGISGKERREKLWEYIVSHRKYFLVQRLRNAIFFAAPGADWWIQSGRLGMGEAQRNPIFWTLALLFHAPLYGFLFFRFLQLCRGSLSPALSFLVLFYLCYWGSYTLFWGEIRFSLPVYPILAGLAPWERIFPKT
jgi:hypothetical protein